MQHYVRLRIADLLAAELHDHDIITCRDRHFVAILPECDRERAGEIVDKIEQAAKEKTGLDLDIGLSVFPEEITFGQLLERAELAVSPPASNGSNGHAFKPELENGRGAHEPQSKNGEKSRQLNGDRHKLVQAHNVENRVVS